MIMAQSKRSSELPDIAGAQSQKRGGIPKWIIGALAASTLVLGGAVYSYVSDNNQPSADAAQSETADGVQSLPASETPTPGAVESGNPTPVTTTPGITADGKVIDDSFPDEYYGYVLQELRSQWGDGSDPHLTSAIATNSLIYSVEQVDQKMPNLSELWASEVDGSMTAGDGLVFKDKDNNTVITFYLDNTAVRPGDNDGTLFAYVTISDSYISSGRVPLLRNEVASLKDSANLMAYSLYTTGGDASSIAGYFEAGKTPSAPSVTKMESYKPQFVITDYSKPADGVYVTLQPMGSDQSMTFKFNSAGGSYAVTEITTGGKIL